jgi:Tfp pilus assembly PilM family ATPase
LVLEFSGKAVRALELNDAGDIILKDEFELSFDINDELRQKSGFKDIKDEFSKNINNLLKNTDQEVKEAGILISTRQTFLNVFPVDFNEEQSNIDSHILWELSNYFPETYKNFNIKYYRLNNSSLNENIDEILLIAIDKNSIEQIKNLCNAANVKIKNLEIDHFAVEKCLSSEYKTENRKVLLLGCNNSRLDYSMLVNGKLKFYDYHIIEDSKFRKPLVDMLNFHGSELDGVEDIFIYGEEYSGNVNKFLNEEFQQLNSKFIRYSNSDDTRFAPLFGLALKIFLKLPVRIISGKYKSRILKSPKTYKIRPHL